MGFEPVEALNTTIRKCQLFFVFLFFYFLSEIDLYRYTYLLARSSSDCFETLKKALLDMIKGPIGHNEDHIPGPNKGKKPIKEIVIVRKIVGPNAPLS